MSTAGMSDEIARLRSELAEMTRRRDEWRKKADGFEAIRLALREKVGAPWPPHMSRLLWAGLAADEKRRADDAEAALRLALEIMRKHLDVEAHRRGPYVRSGCSEVIAAIRAAEAVIGRPDDGLPEWLNELIDGWAE